MSSNLSKRSSAQRGWTLEICQEAARKPSVGSQDAQRKPLYFVHPRLSICAAHSFLCTSARWESGRKRKTPSFVHAFVLFVQPSRRSASPCASGVRFVCSSWLSVHVRSSIQNSTMLFLLCMRDTGLYTRPRMSILSSPPSRKNAPDGP